MPHWIWKKWEEGKMRLISNGLRGMVTIGPEERKGRLVKYLYDSLNIRNTYSFDYFICEALNFINVIGNIFVDKFLGVAFLTYGSDVLKFSGMDQENHLNPMIKIFPRVTKCSFHKYEASDSIQHDALCNILNEKIYIFLWFWFIILSVLSGLVILYSAAIVIMPKAREAVLKRRFRSASALQIEILIRRIQIRNFLMIYLLGKNINVPSYCEVLHSGIGQRSRVRERDRDREMA